MRVASGREIFREARRNKISAGPPRTIVGRGQVFNGPSRRGSFLAEAAIATVMLMIAMTLTVKVVGWVALERRSAERRERALLEVSNVMEQITANSFDDVTPELARSMTLSPAARRSLPGAELHVTVEPSDVGPRRSAKRIAIVLRWPGRSGIWEAPVRLASWIERGRPAS
jgi:hypothetical protein